MINNIILIILLSEYMDYSDKANKYKILCQLGGLIEGRIVNLYFIRHGESMHNLERCVF